MKNAIIDDKSTLEKIKKQLKDNAVSKNDQKVIFFKTGPGDYAEHDRFLGTPTPFIRKIAKQYSQLPLSLIQLLLRSAFNEERLLALFLLIKNYQKATPKEQESLYHFYCKHLHCVNNWNLVDASAHLIIGAHLFQKDKRILLSFASSENLWERRISIVATWYFIKKDKFEWTIKIAKKLLNDKEDLIHKATGWMLREVGKRHSSTLTEFLDKQSNKMPRTMLRYAIEKLDPKLKRHYLEKN